jgi:hypothetical protein
MPLYVESAYNPRETTGLTRMNRPHSHRDHQGVAHLPSPAHVHRQGPGSRHDQLLQTIPLCQAIPPAHNPITRRMSFHSHIFVRTPLTSYRAANTDSPRKSARSSTASTNAFSAPAARPRAPRTGGTRRSTSAPPSSSSHTAGSPTRETRRRLSARMPSTTA